MIITRSNLERIKTTRARTKPSTSLTHRTFATTAITTLSAQAAISATATIIRVTINIYTSTVTSRLTRRTFAAAIITSCTIRTNIAAAKGLAYSFEATLMPKIGHFVMLENPPMFNKLLAELIESVANNVRVMKN